MYYNQFLIKPGLNIDLNEFPTTHSGTLNKDESKKILKENIEQLLELQTMLYAQNKYSVLIVFQAMDAAGKDSTIKHVMSGLNPQGTQVFSFRQPSLTELDHDYLWRIHKSAPERGRIGIFNRSHYEDVLVVKVHNLIARQNLPDEIKTDDIWNKRYRQINEFERHLHENGTIILKFFLHISKQEQKERFLKRIEDKSKNWKFSEDDVKERIYWNDYQKVYQEAISFTSTEYAPWFVIPADKKWFIRLAVSEIIMDVLKKLRLAYPVLDDKQLKGLQLCKEILLAEKH
jgi:PPK2 family polyphosphate:nucleotide phosphotransferase